MHTLIRISIYIIPRLYFKPIPYSCTALLFLNLILHSYTTLIIDNPLSNITRSFRLPFLSPSLILHFNTPLLHFNYYTSLLYSTVLHSYTSMLLLTVVLHSYTELQYATRKRHSYIPLYTLLL